jgi:O-antigen biosynthesis protein
MEPSQHKKLSVIIVNYNVSHFLEQCLLSVEAARKAIDSEVIVVDNNSVDGSLTMLREKFPHITLIANEHNVGFSRANNQGIGVSTGRYVLLLNPDTVVESDTFLKCINFMDAHPDAGGLGVQMVDGKGRFLPESKRALPTPDVAFYKVFGLSALFPKSKRFGRYHLGYLDKEQIHEVDVLSGAFMLLRREALERTGLLDETFFMYGEDIDLSYRITLAGYKNYYFPETRIIHYKGESTRKSSLNYVFIFYQAMIIFAKKHFTGKNARLFSSIIHLAIYFRASMALARRTLIQILYPLLDIGLLWGGIWAIKAYWASYVKFGTGTDYPIEFMVMVVPAYILIWLLSMFFSGAYDRPVNIGKTLKGMGIGTIIILVIYALLPETLRFSRALIILGFFYATLALPFYRVLLNLTGFKPFRTDGKKQRRFVIVGSAEEGERVASVLRKTDPDAGFIGLVGLSKKDQSSAQIGSVNQLEEIVKIYSISEIIFCLKDLETKKIISLMTSRFHGNLEYRIAPPESMHLIGSGAIHSPSDLYLFNLNNITSNANKRNKRLLDVVTSTVLLITSPVFILLQHNPAGLLGNVLKVLAGRMSWVGYEPTSLQLSDQQLPGIRAGVLHPLDGLRTQLSDPGMIHGINMLYARDYHVSTDLGIIFGNFRHLGRSITKTK